MKNRNLALLVLLAGSVASTAAQAATTVETSTKVQERPYSIYMMLDQAVGFKEDTDTYTSFLGGLDLKFNDEHSGRIWVPGRKTYFKNQFGTDREFQIDDVGLYYFYSFREKRSKFDIKFRPYLMLPTSQASQLQGNLLKAGLMVYGTRQFLKKKLTVSYRPYYRHHFNQYTTTVEGNPLVMSSLGNLLYVTYQIIDPVSVGIVLGAATNFMEKARREAPTAEVSGSYSVDLYASYTPFEWMGVRLGYRQGDKFVRDGAYQVFAYDPERSEMYLGLDFVY